MWVGGDMLPKGSCAEVCIATSGEGGWKSELDIDCKATSGEGGWKSELDLLRDLALFWRFLCFLFEDKVLWFAML